MHWRIFMYTEQTFGQWTIMPFLSSGDNMTVLNTADWLLSCSTPSSATSMRDPGTVHVCGGVSLWLLCNFSWFALFFCSVVWTFPCCCFFHPFPRGYSHSQKTGGKLQYIVILLYFERHSKSKENFSKLKISLTA